MHIVCMHLQAKSVQTKHRSALYSLRNDGSKLFINLLPKQLKFVISSKNLKEIPQYILMNGRNQTKFIYFPF